MINHDPHDQYRLIGTSLKLAAIIIFVEIYLSKGMNAKKGCAFDESSS